jgi:hypothetical protein
MDRGEWLVSCPSHYILRGKNIDVQWAGREKSLDSAGK